VAPTAGPTGPVGTTSGPTVTLGQSTVLASQSLVGGSPDLSFVAGAGNVSPPALGIDFLKEIEGLLNTLFNFSTVATGGGVFTPQTFVGSNPVSSAAQSLAQVLKENEGSSGGISTTSDQGHLSIAPHAPRGFDVSEQ
jgi:hypothetical protein